MRRTESGRSSLMHIDLQAGPKALTDRAWACVRTLRVKAEHSTIDEALTRLALDVVPNTQESQEEAEARYLNLRDHLSDYPPDVVKAACAEAGTIFKFMPAWSDLKAICDDHNRFRELLHGAMKRLKPALPAEELEPLTPEQRALNVERLKLMRLALANGENTSVEEITAQAHANLALKPEKQATHE